MTDMLGTVSEIKLTWRLKPELRIKMVRFMMKKHGHTGVKALASVLNMPHREIYKIGGLDGWCRKRNTQRRQRNNRQKKKLIFDMEAEYESSTGLDCRGGKRGKAGGLQDVGRRTIMQAVNGQ